MRTYLTTFLLLLSVIGCKSQPTTIMPGPAKQPPKPPASRPVPLDPALREQARNTLTDALQANQALVRSHAIEAMKQVMPDQTQAFVNALGDKSVAVRYAAAMAAGELKIEDARPALVKLADDRDGRLKVAARYALHRLGDYSRTNDLEDLLNDPLSPQVRYTAALAIGLIGDKSGLAILRPRQRDVQGMVYLQVAESMWRLGDEAGRDALIGASMSRYSDEQMIGTLALGATGDKSVRGHVYSNLTAEYVEVQLAAARVMGQLGSDAGYAIAADAVKSSDPRQRQLAAFALGAIGRSDAQDLLRKLLNDPDQDVQVAAALAILQLRT